MDFESNGFAINFEIQVEHKTPFNISVLTDVIEIIRSASERVSLWQIDESSLVQYLYFPESEARQIRRRLRDFVLANKQNALWLESVASGSSHFKGKILPLALLALAFFSGDVVRDAPFYKEWVHQCAIELDSFEKRLVEEIEKTLNASDQGRNFKTQVGKDGQKILIIVYPHNEQTDISSIRPSPPDHYPPRD